jgi:hypothetical protein
MDRQSKIGSLPCDVLDELNQRMVRGVKGPELLSWLNSNPEAREYLQSNWEDASITKQNLSEWRNGGHRRWLIAEEMSEYAYNFSEEHGKWEGFDASLLGNSLGMALSARYAKFLSNWDGKPSPKVEAELSVLRGLNKDIAILQKTMIQGCDHKTEYLDDRADREEAEVEEMKKKALAPIWALYFEKKLAHIWGDTPAAQKLAAHAAAIEFDLDFPDTSPDAAPVAPTEPVKKPARKRSKPAAAQPVKSDVQPPPVNPVQEVQVTEIQPDNPPSTVEKIDMTPGQSV